MSKKSIARTVERLAQAAAMARPGDVIRPRVYIDREDRGWAWWADIAATTAAAELAAGKPKGMADLAAACTIFRLAPREFWPHSATAVDVRFHPTPAD